MINWERVYKFSPKEFSEDPNKHAEPLLMYSLGDTRRTYGKRMFPSPVKGALARFTGKTTTQHYAVGKRSKASDIFPEGVPFNFYFTVLSMNLFRGIGVYLDTKGPDGLPWIMFHLDIRKSGFTNELPLIWIVENIYDPTKGRHVDKYRYPQFDSSYWNLFNDQRLYTFRERQY